jgi:hypothetical protein
LENEEQQGSQAMRGALGRRLRIAAIPARFRPLHFAEGVVQSQQANFFVLDETATSPDVMYSRNFVRLWTNIWLNVMV